MVPNTMMFFVFASNPQAQVIVSSVLPSKSVSPPYPFHLAIGSRNSIPASSANCASFRLFSHEASHRSGTFVAAIPPEQFGEKIPSFNLFRLYITVCGLPCLPVIGNDLLACRELRKSGPSGNKTRRIIQIRQRNTDYLFETCRKARIAGASPAPGIAFGLVSIYGLRRQCMMHSELRIV